MALDEVSGGQSGHQGELSRQDGGADHTRQLTGVVTGLVGAGALDSEHLKTRQTDRQVKLHSSTKMPPTKSNLWGYITCRQACCGGRLVPPPTVPSSMEGMVQLMYRSSPSGPADSIWVMQLELPIV